jgi:peptide/nickel transport system substrate-binding protein
MPGTYFNFIGYDNPEVTRLVKDSRSATDQVTVAKDLIAAQAEYEKNYGFQALVQLSEISFLRKGLGGMTTSFAYLSEPSLAQVGPSK